MQPYSSSVQTPERLEHEIDAISLTTSNSFRISGPNDKLSRRGPRCAESLRNITWAAVGLQRLDTYSVPVKDEPAVPSKTDSSPMRGPARISQAAGVCRQPRSGLNSAHPSQGGPMRFYNQPHAFYAGIDLHARSTFTHILDHAGKTVLERDLPSNLDSFRNAI